ncbi:MAG: RnfABCDGE type electron transport complex subunit D [Bacteroidales bacterium]|nr:RnfABCDGE type electron transport complex subunit D [Bacteroidales bacterium]MBP5679992.1 RnfABCDGE type electron transport complex subunit D [Bacteroidales bacterium]
MLNVSLSPHVHSGNSTQKCMLQVLIALCPALLWSFYQFGSGAIILTLASVAFCLLFEFLITRFLLHTPSTLGDLSAVVTGVLLAFNVPSNLPVWVIAIGALVAIGVGKMVYGGLGANIFNPALVGRVFLLVAYPVQMTTWPSQAGYADVETGATPLSIIKRIVNGESTLAAPDFMDSLLGVTGGSLGEVSALALLLGGIYLLVRKTITWHIPVSVLLSAFVFGFLFYGGDMTLALDQLVCGGMMLGAIYMATDYVSSPMNSRGQLLYGCCIGFLTIVIRRYGAYPEGMSFAILIMNAFTPLINKYIKPQRFGVVKK